ncbi:MAG TPA: hypothetical protein VHP83_18915 [Aggregatilineaceae bacterium]|nr:hypothetical protein [Aggregatilineaceae bacterium]
MTSESFFLAFLMLGALGLFVVFPLFEREPNAPRRRIRGTPRQKQALEILYAEKQRVLRSIRDLDFDYDLDKIPYSTYASQRINLFNLAAAITERVDSIEAEIVEQDLQIEAAIAALRNGHTSEDIPAEVVETE